MIFHYTPPKLPSHASIDNKLIPHTDHIIKIVCGLINSVVAIIYII